MDKLLAAGDDIYLATPRPYRDYDYDGDVDVDVDGDDLNLFAMTYGDAVAIGTEADGSANGTIDGCDFFGLAAKLWNRCWSARQQRHLGA